MNSAQAITTFEPTRTALQINSFTELMVASEFLAKSQLIPAALRGKPADVAIILQMGLELGIPAMQAINGITVIQGKPTVDPQLAIALIRSKVAGAVIMYGKNNGESLAEVTMARSRETMDEAYTARWDDAKARNLGLLDKPNYKAQKGNMLMWRAVMEASRRVFPDVIKGLYAPDELDHLPDESRGTDKASQVSSLITGKPAEREVVSEVAPAPATPAPLVMESFAQAKAEQSRPAGTGTVMPEPQMDYQSPPMSPPADDPRFTPDAEHGTLFGAPPAAKLRGVVKK